MVGQMDPYLTLQMRDKDAKTHVCKDGNEAPSWGTKYMFPATIADQLVMRVFHQGTTGDSIIGAGSVPVATLLSGDVADAWFPLTHENRPAGEIHLRVQVRTGSASLDAGRARVCVAWKLCVTVVRVRCVTGPAIPTLYAVVENAADGAG